MQSFEWSTSISKWTLLFDGQFPFIAVSFLASFQGYPERKMYMRGFFSHDHDIIEIGPEFLEQKGNILCILYTWKIIVHVHHM